MNTGNIETYGTCEQCKLCTPKYIDEYDTLFDLQNKDIENNLNSVIDKINSEAIVDHTTEKKSEELDINSYNKLMLRRKYEKFYRIFGIYNLLLNILSAPSLKLIPKEYIIDSVTGIMVLPSNCVYLYAYNGTRSIRKGYLLFGEKYIELLLENYILIFIHIIIFFSIICSRKPSLPSSLFLIPLILDACFGLRNSMDIDFTTLSSDVLWTLYVLKFKNAFMLIIYSYLAISSCI